MHRVLWIFLVHTTLNATGAVISSTTPTPPNVIMCPLGWTWAPPMNRCLRPIKIKNFWQGARIACKKLYTVSHAMVDLVSVDQENQMSQLCFLGDVVLQGTDYWIGLNDLNVEGRFAWANSKKVQRFNPTRWIAPPTKGATNNIDCVVMVAQRCLMKDIACSNVPGMAAMCQIDTPDLCRVNKGDCSDKCQPTGLHTTACSCFPGYRLSTDNKTCKDLDECKSGQSKCSQSCRNTVGSYTCDCQKGYTIGMDGITCQDMDECKAYNGGDCQHFCINTIGSFQCRCMAGWEIVEETMCHDISSERKRMSLNHLIYYIVICTIVSSASLMTTYTLGFLSLKYYFKCLGGDGHRTSVAASGTV